MGPKALVPMGPREMSTALFMLTFDTDPAVKETAVKSAAGLPDRILSVALRDETMDPPVLDYYAEVLKAKVEYLEMLVLNASTSDTTVQRIAASADDREFAPGSPEEQAEEQKKLSLAQQIMKLGVAKKIEWANKKGNREVRSILLRDPNKLVQLAVIQSGRITEGEIGKVALSRTSPNEVLQHIY